MGLRNASLAALAAAAPSSQVLGPSRTELATGCIVCFFLVGGATLEQGFTYNSRRKKATWLFFKVFLFSKNWKISFFFDFLKILKFWKILVFEIFKKCFQKMVFFCGFRAF